MNAARTVAPFAHAVHAAAAPRRPLSVAPRSRSSRRRCASSRRSSSAAQRQTSTRSSAGSSAASTTSRSTCSRSRSCSASRSSSRASSATEDGRVMGYNSPVKNNVARRTLARRREAVWLLRGRAGRSDRARQQVPARGPARLRQGRQPRARPVAGAARLRRAGRHEQSRPVPRQGVRRDRSATHPDELLHPRAVSRRPDRLREALTRAAHAVGARIAIDYHRAIASPHASRARHGVGMRDSTQRRPLHPPRSRRAPPRCRCRSRPSTTSIGSRASAGKAIFDAHRRRRSVPHRHSVPDLPRAPAPVPRHVRRRNRGARQQVRLRRARRRSREQGRRRPRRPADRHAPDDRSDHAVPFVVTNCALCHAERFGGPAARRRLRPRQQARPIHAYDARVRDITTQPGFTARKLGRLAREAATAQQDLVARRSTPTRSSARRSPHSQARRRRADAPRARPPAVRPAASR